MLRAALKVVAPQQPPVRIIQAFYTTSKKDTTPGATSQQSKPKIDENVPGLSSNCVNVPNQAAVGPGAAKDKEYKNPEYFCYHVDSFFEAEVELAKHRLPAPSNKVPYVSSSSAK